MKFLSPKLIELADEFVERCEEFPREPEGYRRYDAAEVARTRMFQIPLDHAKLGIKNGTSLSAKSFRETFLE